MPADSFLKAEYDRIADDWLRARRELPRLDQALIDSFVARLPDQAQVLDLGCGGGRPIAMLLAAKGFKVHGVDRSAALLAEARLNLPDATFEQGEIDNYAISTHYAGVVLWDVIFHLPRATHEPLLRRIFDALLPNGVLVLTSGGSVGDEGPFNDTMFGVEFSYDAYPREEWVERCQALGYRLESRVMLNEPDGGRDRGRLGLLLARPPEAIA